MTKPLMDVPTNTNECYDNEAALTDVKTCAGYVFNDNNQNYTSVVNFKTLEGSTVTVNPSDSNKIDVLGGFTPNDLKEAIAAAGYVKSSSCPKSSCLKTSYKQSSTTDLYLYLMITFVILTVVGWLLFGLKLGKVF